MSEQEIYKAALDHYGHISQEDKLIEEMAELTQSILKNRRKWNDIDLTDNLHEEFVDVMICMSQLRIHLDEDMIKEKFNLKLARLRDIISRPNNQPDYPLF